jgi:hypothetical protein
MTSFQVWCGAPCRSSSRSCLSWLRGTSKSNIFCRRSCSRPSSCIFPAGCWSRTDTSGNGTPLSSLFARLRCLGGRPVKYRLMHVREPRCFTELQQCWSIGWEGLSALGCTYGGTHQSLPAVFVIWQQPSPLRI